jgi:hypothetical protein
LTRALDHAIFNRMIHLAQTRTSNARVVTELQGAFQATLADAATRGTRVGIGVGLLVAIASILYLTKQ